MGSRRPRARTDCRAGAARVQIVRLSSATIDRLPAEIARPHYDRTAQRRGIVHLGIGAFHRAHQAVYTDDAMTAGDRGWGITGVSLRSAGVRDALAPQDGLYTVSERSASGTQTRVIGSVHDVIVARDTPALVTAALSHADTHLVTLTVTEKGYHRLPGGALDLDAIRNADDTIYAHLAQGLACRRAEGLPGLTLLSCDNLADNGRVLEQGLAVYLDLVDPGLRGWFESECACPSTMVDRIVPAATAATLDDAEAQMGLRDEGAITTEPFQQWVIEDRFAGPRPRWEAVGAQIVAAVKPYETAKLRLLNGAHSALAYLGLAAGLRFVHEAIADPRVRPVVERIMRNEATASIDAAPGQDLSAYIELLLARFANPALPHNLLQIAADGSQKIGPRWLKPLAINRSRGLPCPATLRALAGWTIFIRGDTAPVDDPMAQEFARLWRSAGSAGIIDALFGAEGPLYAPDAIGEVESAELAAIVENGSLLSGA
ncbi:MAG TPA: mannitol dehydrogenase family protein [Sphingomonas sp.]